jgi:hypothetical protein
MARKETTNNKKKPPAPANFGSGATEGAGIHGGVQGMTKMLFDHVCDLVPEAWHNPAARWATVNRPPVRFSSRLAWQDFGLQQRNQCTSAKTGNTLGDLLP